MDSGLIVVMDEVQGFARGDMFVDAYLYAGAWNIRQLPRPPCKSRRQCTGASNAGFYRMYEHRVSALEFEKYAVTRLMIDYGRLCGYEGVKLKSSFLRLKELLFLIFEIIAIRP
jgi:hypothetical protein